MDTHTQTCCVSGRVGHIVTTYNALSASGAPNFTAYEWHYLSKYHGATQQQRETHIPIKVRALALVVHSIKYTYWFMSAMSIHTYTSCVSICRRDVATPYKALSIS